MSNSSAPVSENIGHSIDYIGQIYGLYRFEGESPYDFKERVLDVFINKSNASTKGLEVGGGRELGQAAKEIGTLIASDSVEAPGIKISSSKITIYSDFRTFEIEKEFNIVSDFPKKDCDIAPYIYDFYIWIEKHSEVWSWKDPISNKNLWLKACGLISNESFEGASAPIQIEEGLNKIGKPIARGSVTSLSEICLNEVDLESEITKKGDYYIDYDLGKVFTKDTGSGGVGSLLLSTYKRSVSLDWSPVSINNLSDKEWYESLKRKEIKEENNGYRSIGLSEELVNLIIKAYQNDGTHWFAKDINNTPFDINESYMFSDVITDEIESYYLDTTEANSPKRES